MKYYLWCFERGMWWKSGEYGYTILLSEAGIYTEEQALKICMKANIVMKNLPQEAMVPVQEAEATAKSGNP
jgi:hypothetical protein